MNRRHAHVLTALALAGALGACGGETSGGLQTAAAPHAGAVVDLRFSGEVVVSGALDPEDPGSLTVMAFLAGAERPVLARSWEMRDPAWRVGRQERRLYFHLDARDRMPGAPSSGALGSGPDAVELVARWDPDGNPATEEAGVSEARVREAPVAAGVLLEVAADRVLVHEPAPPGHPPSGG